MSFIFLQCGQTTKEVNQKLHPKFIASSTHARPRHLVPGGDPLGVDSTASPGNRNRVGVAQICNLLYRRIAFCWRWKQDARCHVPKRLVYRALADCKSAIQQIENLRYSLGAPSHRGNPASFCNRFRIARRLEGA
jgi:hypothetical protein